VLVLVLGSSSLLLLTLPGVQLGCSSPLCAGALLAGLCVCRVDGGGRRNRFCTVAE
jgi:hypothetical protein